MVQEDGAEEAAGGYGDFGANPYRRVPREKGGYCRVLRGGRFL